MEPVERPRPRRTKDSEPYWDGCAEHRLRLQRCDGCATVRYPPMPGCPRCGAPEHMWADVEPEGRVVRSTVVHARMHPSFEVPYALIVVELDCGALVLSRFVGPPEVVEHGLRVRGTWEDLPSADTALLLFEAAPG